VIGHFIGTFLVFAIIFLNTNDIDYRQGMIRQSNSALNLSFGHQNASTGKEHIHKHLTDDFTGNISLT